MRGIVTWFVNNSVPSNLFMFFLIVGGFFISYPSIKAEFFPTPDPKAVTIGVPYPGASASEVEASISSKIEDRLEGVAGIKKINSRSLEGYGYVGIRVFPSADFDNTVEEIKTIIDGITTFPENSEEQVPQEPALDIIDVNPGEGEFEEMPEPEPKPKPKPKPKRKKSKEIDEVRITPPKEVKPTKKVDDVIPAKITISADISAKIFIDGKLVGPAPIINKQISPGKHSVQLAPASGGIKDIKKFTIDVKPGKTMIYQWSFNDERWLRRD